MMISKGPILLLPPVRDLKLNTEVEQGLRSAVLRERLMHTRSFHERNRILFHPHLKVENILFPALDK